MTREIKFRAWDGKVMIYYDKQYGVGGGDSETDVIFFANTKVNTIGKSFELMQFTGLLDRNSKEIYEGDIVKHFHKDVIGKVIYQVTEYCVWEKIVEEDRGTAGQRHTLDDPWTVIGNIYENPELCTK